MGRNTVMAKTRPDPECLTALAGMELDIAAVLDSRVKIEPVSEFSRWTPEVWSGATTLSGPGGLTVELVKRYTRIIAADILHTLDMRADGETYPSIGLDIAMTMEPDSLTLAWKFAWLTREATKSEWDEDW